MNSPGSRIPGEKKPARTMVVVERASRGGSDRRAGASVRGRGNIGVAIHLASAQFVVERGCREFEQRHDDVNVSDMTSSHDK